MSDFSRRTVVRGVAWTVPVVAVAANAPAFATSHEPPPPDVNLGGSCANTGANNKGCGTTDKSLQIPVTVQNTSLVPIVFQVTALFTSNGDIAPTASGAGVYTGVSGIFATNSSFTENFCQTVTKSNCGGGTANGSVVVAPNTTAYFFVVSAQTATSSNFSATIDTRLLDATTCLPIAGTTARKSTVKAISNNNCD